jgi:protein-tyrosine phosphatase
MPPPRLSISVVCTGNICRSPLGHAVLAAKLDRAGLGDEVRVTSSGTHGHVGWSPDERSVRVASHDAGYKAELGGIRARMLGKADFEENTLLLAMDEGHYRFMLREAGDAHRDKVRLFMQFKGHSGTSSSPTPSSLSDLDVPDPYYDDMGAFELVLSMVEAGTDGIVNAVKKALESKDPAAALRAATPQLPAGRR